MKTLKNLWIIISASLLLIVLSISITASSAGPNSGQNFTNNNTIGQIAWISPQNASASDTLNAKFSSTVLLPRQSNYLYARNFSFNIPSTAIINGVVVEVQATYDTQDTGVVADNSVRLIKNGIMSGLEMKNTTGLWGDFLYQTYSNSTGLWNLSLTPADVNNATFGVGISGSIGGKDTPGALTTGYINHIRMTIYYSTADPCTGSASGSCIVNCATNYTFSTNAQINGSLIIENGSSSYASPNYVFVNANISTQNVTKNSTNCIIAVKSGSTLDVRR